MKSDNLDSLVVCRGCLAILPTGQIDSNDFMKDELFRIANVKFSELTTPISLCPQCKDIVTLFKSFRIQVVKANAVLSDLADKFQRGKTVKSRHVHEERQKYILPRIVLTAKDDKTLTEILEEQTNATSYDVPVAPKDDDNQNAHIKHFGVTFACNATSERGAHDIKRLQCTDDNCNRIFSNVTSLKNHTASVHMTAGSDVDKFFCPVLDCKHSTSSRDGKPFSNRGLLKQHYIKVHVQKKFPCFKCEMKFPTSAMRSRHEKSCSQNIVCSHCSIKFLKQESFTSHLMRKHPQKYGEYLQKKKIARGVSRSTDTAERSFDSKATGSECAVTTIERAAEVSPRPSTSADTLMESVLFSDQFTQTAIKTAPKRKPNTSRSSAQTQTFERPSRDRGTNYDAVTAHALGGERSAGDGSSPLLSFASFDSRGESNSITIETQTSLDELLYSNKDMDSNLFPELVSLSDIQTQTVWNDSGDLNYDFGPMDLLNCFDRGSATPVVDYERSPRTVQSPSPIAPTPTRLDLLSNLTSSPDLTFKGTQTYFSFGDSPKQTSITTNRWI